MFFIQLGSNMYNTGTGKDPRSYKLEFQGSVQNSN